MRILMSNLSLAALLFIANAAHASMFQINIGDGSTVDVAYFGSGFSSYSVSGSIQGETAGSVLTITGGSLTLSGPGPDTSMTITPGQLSFDGVDMFWDFGQGPFDVGVPAENPGYILDSTGLTGTLGDMFGNLGLMGPFGAEGFGLADDSSTHSMSSFFWFGETVVVPIPAGIWLFGSALAGLGLARRRR